MLKVPRKNHKMLLYKNITPFFGPYYQGAKLKWMLSYIYVITILSQITLRDYLFPI